MKRIIATSIALLFLCSVAEAHRLSGTATYYGGTDRLCGRRTASGAVFNCSALTAAHRTLPFGTVLSVQSGGRSVQVTVTDRGPFSGAFLDLSPAAASAKTWWIARQSGRACSLSVSRCSRSPSSCARFME